jgi:hypothetical protein
MTLLTSLGNVGLYNHSVNLNMSLLLQMSNLTDLSFSYYNYNQMTFLTELTNLTTLILYGENITTLEFLSTLTNLKSLNLNGCHNVIGDRDMFLPFRSLTNLDISNILISTEIMESIASLPELISLEVGSFYGAFDIRIDTITTLLNLQSLVIAKSLSDEDMKELSKLTNLTYLKMSSLGSYTDKGIKYICNLPKLNFLHLANIHLTILSICYLAQLRSLTSLVFVSSELDITAVNILTFSSSCKNITLFYCNNISKLDVIQFRKKYPHLEITYDNRDKEHMWVGRKRNNYTSINLIESDNEEKDIVSEETEEIVLEDVTLFMIENTIREELSLLKLTHKLVLRKRGKYCRPRIKRNIVKVYK